MDSRLIPLAAVAFVLIFNFGVLVTGALVIAFSLSPSAWGSSGDGSAAKQTQRGKNYGELQQARAPSHRPHDPHASRHIGRSSASSHRARAPTSTRHGG